MKAVLERGESTDQGTFGVLRFGLVNVTYTLELPWRDNQRKRSCIPVGEYECRPVRSPKFGDVYKVLSVPDRSSILFHPANFAGDVELGYTSQLEGCIAPCSRIGTMRNNAGQMQAAGLVSRPAFNKLMSWAAGRRFTLEIR